MRLSTIKSLFIKNKSNIFSGFIFILPLCILAFAKNISLNQFEINTVAFLMIIFLSFIYLAPKYVSIGIKIEDYINLKLAAVTPSRLIRVLFHAPLIWGIYFLGDAIGLRAEANPVILVLASSGLHAIAVTSAYHGIGDRVGNIIFSLSLSSSLVSLVLAYFSSWPVSWFLVFTFLVHIVVGLLSDIRGVLYPRAGVGIYFGTFNPIHKTHLKIIQAAIELRGLQKVYIHCTTVPKLHRIALENNEISMKMHGGMRVYKKTELADSSKNYFPTGNKFYEYEIRKELIKAGIQDANLTDFIEVLDLPVVYEQEGFFGIIKHIKKINPKGTPIHGIHGSDTGGIWVRNIFDDSGWIYPYPVIRKDDISATSIREGAIGYTSPTIEAFLSASRAGQSFKFPSGYIFSNHSINHPVIGNNNVSNH